MYLEFEKIELKENYSDTIFREIVAFLNTDGGVIYVGIKNNGETNGLDINKIDEIQKRISDIITTQIEPIPNLDVKSEVITEDNKSVLKIVVKKGFMPIYCIKKYGYSTKGCLERKGSTCKEM